MYKTVKINLRLILFQLLLWVSVVTLLEVTAMVMDMASDRADRRRPLELMVSLSMEMTLTQQPLMLVIL